MDKEFEIQRAEDQMSNLMDILRKLTKAQGQVRRTTKEFEDLEVEVKITIKKMDDLSKQLKDMGVDEINIKGEADEDA